MFIKRHPIIFITIIWCIVLIAPILWVLARGQRIQFDSTSMEPAIKKGQMVRVEPYEGKRPARNDVVVYKHPDGKSQNLMHRVAGMPGDRVTISENTLVIYNQSHPAGYNPDTYLNLTGDSPSVDVTLGADQYFMLGDNSVNSFDSRYHGAISLSSIVFRVKI
jgi:signal peptidase I